MEPFKHLRGVLAAMATCPVMSESLDMLVTGIVELLESGVPGPAIAKTLRTSVPHPANPAREVPLGQALRDAVTLNTSHVAVDPRHPGYETAHRLLTQTPELDKAAHIATLEQRVASRDADVEKLTVVVDEWSKAHAAIVAERDSALAALQSHADQLSNRDAELARAADKAAAHAQHIEALTAHVAAKDAVIAAKTAQLEAAKAEVFDTGTVTGNGAGDLNPDAITLDPKAET